MITFSKYTDIVNAIAKKLKTTKDAAVNALIKAQQKGIDPLKWQKNLTILRSFIQLVADYDPTIDESQTLQATMALDDVGIKSKWKKGKLYIAKRDVKKAEKALSKSFRKGGEPDLYFADDDPTIDERDGTWSDYGRKMVDKKKVTQMNNYWKDLDRMADDERKKKSMKTRFGIKNIKLDKKGNIIYFESIEENRDYDKKDNREEKR